MTLERVKSKTYIPTYRYGNVYITAAEEILFLHIEHLPSFLFMKFHENRLFVALDSGEGFERVPIRKWKENGIHMASIRLPKSMVQFRKHLIQFSAVGVTAGGNLATDVCIIERTTEFPKALIDRFVFNATNLCSIETTESEGNVKVEDDSPVSSKLYIDNKLVCVRTFDFKSNKCQFGYTTLKSDHIRAVANAYRFLNYDNKHVSEVFLGDSKIETRIVP